MKQKVLTIIKEKHNRCTLGLGTFKHDLLKWADEEELNKTIKELKREKRITERVGTLGTLYNYKN